MSALEWLDAVSVVNELRFVRERQAATRLAECVRDGRTVP